MQRSIALPVQVATECVAFLESTNTLWLATPSGQVATLRLADGRFAVRGSGYGAPAAVVPAADGLGLFVVEAGGAVFVAARSAPGRSAAVALADLGAQAVTAALHPDGDALVALTAGPDGALVRCAVDTGVVAPVATGFEDPVALVVDPASRTAVVLHQPAGIAELVAVDLDSGSTTTLPAGDLDGVTAVTTAPGGAGVLAAGADAAGITLVGSGSVTRPGVGVDARAIARWESLVLVVHDAGVVALEWDLDEGDLPMSMPLGPAWANGYLSVDVDPAALGLDLSELDVSVDGGPDVGVVSAAIEPPNPDGTCRLRVLPAGMPGEHLLIARQGVGGPVIGRGRFRVTRHWPDDEVGPPVVITGPQQLYAWGGGPNAAQNIGVHPAPADWRVAVVFVQTRSRALEDLPTQRTDWDDHLFGTGGLTARTFYEEVSYRNTADGPPGAPVGTTIVTAPGQPFAPILLDKGWGEYFKQNGSEPWSGWDPKHTLHDELAGAMSDAMLDNPLWDSMLHRIDAVVFVVQTATEGASAVGTTLAQPMFVWPQKKIGQFHSVRETSDGVRLHSFPSIPIVYMPSRMPSLMPADQQLDPVPTVIHELGHTFGLDDLYNADNDFPPEITVRDIGPLDTMSENFDVPHFSMPNRMRLNWVAADWIERFDFSRDPSGHEVTLQAAESLERSGPSGGRKAAVEIRIRDGWNYYFEYRRAQPGQLGDQALTPAKLVLGTDVTDLEPNHVARPSIILLPLDADGDGPMLTTSGTDYQESDVTDPQRTYDFGLSVVNFDPADDDSVRVEVSFQGAARPDLRISPAPGNGDWKSPDIDLESPAGPNTVAKGRTQTIVVHVHNDGSVTARQVRLQVDWLEFTTSPSGWMPLTDPPRQDVPAHDHRDFRVDWTVPADPVFEGRKVEHFCVRVRIDRYIDDRDPAQNEITVANNWAQSNFNTAAVAHGSPSDRHVTGLLVANTVGRTATYLTVLSQSGEMFRAYLGNAWLQLGAGRRRMVEFAYESLAGDPQYGDGFDALSDGEHAITTHLSATSLVVPPAGARCPTPRTVWGAGVDLRAGFRTAFRDLVLNGDEGVTGLVTSADGSASVGSGDVCVALWRDDRPGEEFPTRAQLRSDGSFFAGVPEPIRQAVHEGASISGEGFYLGNLRWAGCRSGERPLA